MDVERTIDRVRRAIGRRRLRGRTVGFVPTMGALHHGHMSLVDRARGEDDVTVVSIYVNPTQFAPHEDFASYPRTLEVDLALLEAARVDVVFVPDDTVMYPRGFATHVEVESLTEGLCGAKRPGHFRGVTTVVTKLLCIVRPDRVYLGQKDAQQAAVIRRMVRDLDLGLEVVVCPTVRDPDGLAASSRNSTLSDVERKIALVVPRSLAAVARAFASGERRAAALRRTALETLNAQAAVYVDYAEVVGADDIRPLATVDRPALVAVAVRVGRTRLIDNVTLDPSSAPPPGVHPPPVPAPPSGAGLPGRPPTSRRRASDRPGRGRLRTRRSGGPRRRAGPGRLRAPARSS